MAFQVPDLLSQTPAIRGFDLDDRGRRERNRVLARQLRRELNVNPFQNLAYRGVVDRVLTELLQTEAAPHQRGGKAVLLAELRFVRRRRPRVRSVVLRQGRYAAPDPAH